MKRSKKFKLDKEAINKIDSEYDDRDLSNYTNYEVYEEEKPRHRFLKKLVKRLIILCAVVLVINLAVLLYTGRLWFNEPKKRDYPIRGPVVTESMGEIRWKSFAKQNIQTAYIEPPKALPLRTVRSVTTGTAQRTLIYQWEHTMCLSLILTALSRQSIS